MKPIKRAIILCWIMLVACFAIKLFGGNWFEIVCTNEHFSNICRIVDNNKIIWCIVSYSTYITSSSIIIFACSKNKSKLKKSTVFLVFCCLTICWLSQFISVSVKTILEILAILFIPTILSVLYTSERKSVVLKNVWYRGILCSIITFGFQAISFITRNVGIVIVDDNTLISMILLIDYYIMSILFYLHFKATKMEVK